MEQVIISSGRNRRARLRTFTCGFLLTAAAVALMTFYIIEWMDSIDPDIFLLPPAVSALLFAVGAGMLVTWIMSWECSIDVKADGVWGTTMYGKNVFLPVNQITRLGKKNSVFCITAGKRKYRFAFLDNVPQLREAIRGLQQRETRHEYRQNSLARPADQKKAETFGGKARKKTASSSRKRRGSAAIARDLKRYKKLCDQGIITQEEFETKKRQLLEL